jgi:hypothetical protein
MTLGRAEPPLAAQEREMLNSWLEFHRDTLALKCDGLTAGQLRQRAVPPSSLSLLGLVRHMAEGERQWFAMVLGGEQIPYHYYTDDDPETGPAADTPGLSWARGWFRPAVGGPR